MIRLGHAAVLLIACLTLTLTDARADQNDERLPALFDTLKSTNIPAEAQETEGLIWTIWLRHPSDDQANHLMDQGTSLMRGGHLPEALAVFHNLVEANPEFAEAWNKRATVHYLMGNLEASVFDIQETLERESRHFGALAGLGLIYLAIEKPKAALRAFRAGLAINPHMPGPKLHVEQLEEYLKGEKL